MPFHHSSYRITQTFTAYLAIGMIRSSLSAPIGVGAYFSLVGEQRLQYFRNIEQGQKRPPPLNFKFIQKSSNIIPELSDQFFYFQDF